MQEVNDWVEKMEDEDEFVRLNAAERIDPIHLPYMMEDKHWPIREVVASRIDPIHLFRMREDKNEKARQAVAERMIAIKGGEK